MSATKKVSDTPKAKIMQALGKGQKIKCEVYNSLEGSKLEAWVVGVRLDPDGCPRYITEEGWHYKNAVPVKKKVIVKSAHELATLFIKEGYTINSYGSICSPNAEDTFVANMWEYCGKEPANWNWDPSWLTEVEE